jgi:Ca2+-transporting ATPase
MFASATLSAGAVIASFLHGLASGPVETARTRAFATLVAAESLRVFALRSRTKTLLQVGLRSNLRLAAVVFGTLAAQALVLSWTPLRQTLRTEALPPAAWPPTLLLSLLPVTLLELWKPFRRGLASLSRRAYGIL